MRNKVLFTLMICLATITSSWAQTLPNNSFETWVTDTDFLDLTVTTPNVLDTSISPSPSDWTTVNTLSNTNTFHHNILVTESSTSYTGNHAVQLVSDTLKATLNVGFTINLNFVCPGFVVSGSFPINFSAFTSLLGQGSFNPALLPGAGVPISGRIASIGGYLKYAPVGGDTAYVIAVLRKGTTVVATATYLRYTTDPAYSYFEAPFVYQNCILPDTLVYTLSSANPYKVNSNTVTSSTGLHQGSTLLADSLYFTGTVVYGEAYPAKDSLHTYINTPIYTNVLALDSACGGGSLALDSVYTPQHGTAVISGDSILYTPAHGFSGLDTFYYVVNVGIGPYATGMVVVNVSGNVGINEVAEGKTSIYPNPASNKLYVTTANPSVSELRIYDMLGKVMKAESFYANAAVDLNGFSNGLYIIQFSGADGKMISSSHFIVVK